MNIEIANRLTEYRKKAGLSQEELADKLGISRQAVSKWERGEASPDTDNLIALSKIYGVSLDDLLFADPKEKEEKPKENGEGLYIEDDDGSRVEISKDGIRVIDGDEKVHIGKDIKPKESVLWAIVSSGALVIAGIVAYIIVGLFWNDRNIGWSMGWTFILDGIWLGSFYQCFAKKKVSNFLYPIFVTSLYCKLGFFGSYFGFMGWQVYWFLFITIPLFYAVAAAIDRATRASRHGEEIK